MRKQADGLLSKISVNHTAPPFTTVGPDASCVRGYEIASLK